MITLLPALLLLVTGGLFALLAGRQSRAATVCGAGGAVAGCTLGLLPALLVLRDGVSLTQPVHLFAVSGRLLLDPLAALFLVLIFALGSLAAVYGAAYWRHEASARSAGAGWFWCNLLIAAMALVVTAADGILLLVGWELMTFASFFLVTHERTEDTARAAGWLYLTAAQFGAAFLIALFCLGGFSFASFAAGDRAGLLFLLALAGFGTKAGIVPLHVWLPEAHPAAPSHVSALMSGVMIKTGIYGILRLLTLLPAPAPWWGWTLLVLGLLSGLYGIMLALAQDDLKRFLACSSIENIGIIVTGLGLGVLGQAYGLPLLAALGFAGALLHCINHALAKALLFFGAGAVLHATGTRSMHRLGGLLKVLPWTGAAFAAGALALSGLPPLNVFAGEFVIYLAALQVGMAPTAVAGAGVAVLVGLALTGGLAAAGFTMVFGSVFLGAPRQERRAHEAAYGMRFVMAVLALLCLLFGVMAPLVLWHLAPALGVVAGPAAAARVLAAASIPLLHLTLLAAILLLGVGTLAWCVRRMLARRSVRVALTWDCGYTRPTARMQYTPGSFAQPLTSLFAPMLGRALTGEAVRGLFPAHAARHAQSSDVWLTRLYAPLFSAFEQPFELVRRLQQGRVQLYILYMVIALVALLLWKL